jgi:molybdopterin adenylyltransferase
MSDTQGAPQLRVGIISISDRASQGVYTDQGIPALKEWLSEALLSPFATEARLIADEQQLITSTIIELVDEKHCHLVLTTGGTGPSRRDVTPEATLAAGTREMPGFGEQMRQISLRFVPTAILSRQTAVVREIEGHAALVINLPGQPKSIRETLEGLKDAAGNSIVPGIFAAVPYCLDLIDAPYIETNPEILAAFRPKSARRPPMTTSTAPEKN